MVTINVSTDASGNVTLSGNGNATSPPNGDVQWNVTGNSIQDITITPIIQPGQGESNIWSTAPRPFPLPTSKNWQGTVNSSDGNEYYSLGYTKSDGSTGSIDPKITVSAGNR
mgnify:CR=1 FL=1